MKAPKYSSPEIERRWLAEHSALPNLKTLDSVTIEDLYIHNSRIRLRKMQLHYREETQYKLCKKYGKLSDIAEPIVNIYLDEAEYTVLNQLPGKRVTRERYHYPYRGIRFRICVLPYSSAAGTDSTSIAANGKLNNVINHNGNSGSATAAITEAAITEVTNTKVVSTESTNSSIIIVEAEFKTEALAKAFRPPPFCGREVSADPEFEVPSLIAALNLSSP